ncbi:hypothetical protein [Alysiella crassa]|uniref:hypothetical protein n=1 Tax=Alysiella crassa TaxID=153491 RepID=UPI001FD47570|nr:hypothetical protein [Alysiella crassa]UOP07839.1 hypothetical protein LVJ80_05755 [Alysiella crassa]
MSPRNVGCAVRTKCLNNLSIVVDLVRTVHPTLLPTKYHAPPTQSVGMAAQRHAPEKEQIHENH